MMLQLPFHGIDPVFLRIGPVELRWYGLMYMLGFAVAYWVLRRVADEKRISLSRDELYDLLFYLILGVMVGGRLGYVLFYDLGSYLNDPVSILYIWRGGMSFHGGLVGVVAAAVWTARRRGWAFWELSDAIALSVPIGLGLGRIGNFINGELYGRESTLPWAMVFPAGGASPRHPSQLYEAFLEGIVLFLFLLWLYRRHLPAGGVFWGLVAGYGLARFTVEFVRAPDAQIGFDIGPLTRGPVLSLPRLLMGTLLLVRTAYGGGSRVSAARSDRPARRPSKKK